MQFHYGGWPGFGYYADPYAGYGDPYGGYGGYAGAYGYGDPYYGYGDPAYGYADPYGYYAQDEPGWGQDDTYGYADDEQVGYYAQDSPFDGDVGYADEASDGYGWGYGYADDDPSMAGWYGEGEQDFGADEGWDGYGGGYGYSGFVREGPSPFNAGCPMPSNVAGPEADDSLAGYGPPANVNASVEDFRPQPGGARGVPDTFRPLW